MGQLGTDCTFLCSLFLIYTNILFNPQVLGTYASGDPLFPKNHLDGIHKLPTERPLTTTRSYEVEAVNQSRLNRQESNEVIDELVILNELSKHAAEANEFIRNYRESIEEYEPVRRSQQNFREPLIENGIRHSEKRASPSNRKTIRIHPLRGKSTEFDERQAWNDYFGARQGLESTDERRRRKLARWKKLGPIRRQDNYRHLQPVTVETIPLEKALAGPIQQVYPITITPLPTVDDDPISSTVPHRRPRIQGPILANFDSDSVKSEFLEKESSSALLDEIENSLSPPQPRSLNSATEDYHFRSVQPVKAYKFSQKLIHRPRLRIRRPGEPIRTKGDQAAAAKALSLPGLSELRPLSDIKSNGVFDANGDFGPGGDGQGVVGDSAVKSDVEAEANSGSGFGGGNTSGGGPGIRPPPEFGSENFEVNGEPNKRKSPVEHSAEIAEDSTDSASSAQSGEERKGPVPHPRSFPSPASDVPIPVNSGLRVVKPPSEFEAAGGFGSSHGSGTGLFSSNTGTFGSGLGSGPSDSGNGIALGSGQETGPSSDIFTGDSALTPNRVGPSGDGYGPPIFPGAAIPPPVPAVSVGGGAAGKPPYPIMATTANPISSIKPSALLSVLNKADIGFNQAINHFEQGTPLEAAAIDILEVALGSQKLDSQARLLGHVDRAIGIDNLQRLQRWANTGGALDLIKQEFVKFAKHYSLPENLPTLPPQLEYLFRPSG